MGVNNISPNAPPVFNPPAHGKVGSGAMASSGQRSLPGITKVAQHTGQSAAVPMRAGKHEGLSPACMAMMVEEVPEPVLLRPLAIDAVINLDIHCPENMQVIGTVLKLSKQGNAMGEDVTAMESHQHQATGRVRASPLDEGSKRDAEVVLQHLNYAIRRELR